jgi:NADPH:quinone reductase-like Zn-dependent oxidoreductase/SAM-dependent methyltransferase/acyl carrier protein
MAVAATKAAGSSASFATFPVIRQLELVSALFLADHDTPPVQITVVDPRGENPMSFQISSRLKEKVTLHAKGVIHYAKNDERRESPEGVTLAEIRSRCQEVIPRDDYYQKLSEIGLQYGPNFQCIQTLYRGDRESLGWIELSDALEPEIQIYELHPILIDACLQVLGAAFTAKDKSDLLVPVYIEQVRVFGRLPADLWSHASLQQPADGTRAFVRGDVRLLDDMGHVVAEVSGVHLQPMPKTIRPKATEDPIRDWLYELVWQQLRDSQPARSLHDDMPSPHRIAAQLQARFETLSEQQGLAKYTELEPQLNVLCSAYVLKAIQQIGWELRTGSRVAMDFVTESLGVSSRHARLFHRMLEMLAEDGILGIADSSWEVRRVPPTEDPEKLREKLLNQYPAFKAELKLLGLGGSQLARVLRGQTDPLEVLFQAGSVSNVEMLYQESPAFRVYNTLVGEAIQTALEALAPGRVARILEIGAGTGATSASVLSRLPRERVEYVFTDLSPLFTAYAKKKFRAYSFVRCETLDIERDPKTQGFPSHQFDVILAANVLHATRNLRETLQHVQQLLTPGGMVILLEVTRPQRGLDLVFGLTEGWWKFADLDVRPHYPLLSQQKWRELFQESGFADAAVIPHSSSANTEYNQTVIMARGPRLDEVKTAEVKPQSFSRRGPWILLADAAGVAQRLGTLLRSSGERCIFVNAGPAWNCSDGEHFSVRPDRPEDLQELFKVALDSGEQHCAGIVHLWSLDALPTDAVSDSMLKSAETNSCMSAVRMIQGISRVNWAKVPRLFLVTRGVQPIPDTFVPEGLAQSPLWGVGRVVFQEHPELRCTMVDLSTDPAPEEIASLAHVLDSDDPENQIALRGEARYLARLLRLSEKPQATVDGPEELPLPSSENYHLETSSPGLLKNLTVKAASRLAPGPGQIEIQVFAAGLNFRDVMIAMGLYPGATSTIFGDECSGKIVAVGEGVDRFQVGDEVVAIAPSSFSAFSTTSEILVARKPSSLSFEEAAAIPLVFVTVYYALRHLANLGPGERVLIHSASGGVGLAAIQVARSVGAEIYATAGSQEKREFLRSIGIQHVMDSRSLAFADEVMERTKGLGVDVILNSLTGEAITKGLSILAPYGRFLEIGKRAIFEDAPVGLRLFQNSQSFFAIDVERLCLDRTALIGKILEEIVARFNDGTFQPLRHEVFPLSEARSAFRRMAQAKHIGKIVFSSPPKLGGVARSAGVVPEPRPIKLGLEEPPRLAALGTPPNLGGELFHANATYLITGGLGGLGLLVAEWMAEQGAGHLVLIGRSNASVNAEEKLRAISATGARVVVERADVSDRNQLAAIIDRIRDSMPPLRGVIHAAGTLDDGLILQLDETRFAHVMRPKVQGAWHLHTLTADSPLDFFIMFSSAASILGPPGQANHAAANTFLDHLAHLRRRQGKPAASINWGPWAEVGAAARPDRAERLMERGVQSMLPRQGLDILQHLMRQGSTQAAVIPMDWARWRRLSSDLGRWPLLSEITQPGAGAAPSADIEEKVAVLRDLLLGLDPVERPRELQRYLCEQVAKVLERPASSLDTEEPLNNAGLDSIMALELKNHLEIQMGIAIPMVRFLQGYSIDQLVSEVLDLLAAKSEAPPTTLALAAAAGADQGSHARNQLPNTVSMLHTDVNRVREAVDQLSETEIDSLLNELLTEQEGQE